MPLSAASPDDPVKVYYDSLEKLHAKVRKYSPFTYIAYKSLIPSKEDDFIGLAYKISYYITFKFFIHLGSHMASPLFEIIPFVPVALDLFWAGYQWIRSLKERAVAVEPPSPLTTAAFALIGLVSMNYLDRLPSF